MLKKELISAEIYKNRQSAVSSQIWKLGDNKVRLTVTSDSYDFQSSAIAEVWNANDLKWNRIHTIPFSLMRTPHKLYYVKEALTNSYFQKDIDDLMKVTTAILQ